MADFPQPFGYAWGSAIPDQAQALLDSAQFEGLAHFFSNPSNSGYRAPHHQVDWINTDQSLSAPNTTCTLPFGLQEAKHLETTQNAVSSGVKPVKEQELSLHTITKKQKPQMMAVPMEYQMHPSFLEQDHSVLAGMGSLHHDTRAIDFENQAFGYSSVHYGPADMSNGYFGDTFDMALPLEDSDDVSALAGANLLQSLSNSANLPQTFPSRSGLPFGSDTGFTQYGFSPYANLNTSMICPRNLDYTQTNLYESLDNYNHDPRLPFQRTISHPSPTSDSVTTPENHTNSTGASTAPSVLGSDEIATISATQKKTAGASASLPLSLGELHQAKNAGRKKGRPAVKRVNSTAKDPKPVRGRKTTISNADGKTAVSQSNSNQQNSSGARRPRLSSEDRKRNHTLSEKLRREKTARYNNLLLEICGLSDSKDTKAHKLNGILEWLHKKSAQNQGLGIVLSQCSLSVDPGEAPLMPEME